MQPPTLSDCAPPSPGQQAHLDSLWSPPVTPHPESYELSYFAAAGAAGAAGVGYSVGESMTITSLPSELLEIPSPSQDIQHEQQHADITENAAGGAAATAVVNVAGAAGSVGAGVDQLSAGHCPTSDVEDTPHITVRALQYIIQRVRM